MMDSQRGPEQVLTVPAHRLGFIERVWRACKKTFGVTGSLLLLGNVLLILMPIPHVHLCLFPLAFVLGPLLGYFAWRDRVVLAATALPCPHCHRTVTVPEGLSGWPARFNCDACGIMVELNPAAE
jgi:hypothetical protein